MAEDNIIEWTAKQPDWAQDALRRHTLFATLDLNDHDEGLIYSNVRHEAGFTLEQAPVYQQLTAAHLASLSGSGPRTTLCSLGPVRNLNRLAADQVLSFATNGITLIYGDNGTGKSGYCRITKKLCRSLTADDLLGNVLEAGAKPPAEVVVRYRLDGQDAVVEEPWVDGTPPPAQISQISVFDAQNARLYVDKENRIGFLPTEIALLERHGAHRAEMEAAFEAEMAPIEKRAKIALPAGYTPGGTIAGILGRLAWKAKGELPSEDEIKSLASWTVEDAAQLDSLEVALAHDPASLAARCRRAKAVLEGYRDLVATIGTKLSSKTAEDLQTLRETARATAEAAALAATHQFASEPLPSVGLPAWRLMNDHAKAYAASIGFGEEHLPHGEGDRCLLCQEPLSSTAVERITRFNDFVADKATKDADTALGASNAARRELLELDIPTEERATLQLGEFSGLGGVRSSAAETLVSYFTDAAARRTALLAGMYGGSFADIQSLPASPAALIQRDIGALEREALGHDKAAAGDGGRADERSRLNELKDRKKLADDLATVLARRDDLNRLHKLAACCAAVENGSVSRQITALRRSMVTQDLERRIQDEINSLDLSHIPFVVSDRSRDGRSLFEVGLKSLTPTANQKILSEGEQRALALACFLGEVAADTGRHGLIIDDPVSSLDHVRIRRVAMRLVGEAAKGRQVVIFTHNLLFFNEVVDAAGRHNPQVPLVKRFVTKSAPQGFGLVSESDEPWIAMAVSKRINMLQERLAAFKNINDFDTDDWRRKGKDFYTDLRETWERLVEEVLLGKVVERFNTDVRTQSLAGVTVEDDDYRIIYWAMKRASERSGHDMAAGRAIPTPTLEEMKGDLAELDAYRAKANTRRRAAEERRRKYEKPPAPEVV